MASLEEQLEWVRQRYAMQLMGEDGLERHGQMLREGLLLLIDMRFTKPPKALLEHIQNAPMNDVLQWSARAFQINGLVGVCREILSGLPSQPRSNPSTNGTSNTLS